MIKIAICENDILDAQRISTILGAHKASSEFETVYFQSGSEIEADMNCHQYDLYIFDVELEDKETGLHYAQLVKDKYPAAVILFVSGHERYARFGYLSGAIRFVYKPQLLKELPSQEHQQI